MNRSLSYKSDNHKPLTLKNADHCHLKPAKKTGKDIKGRTLMPIKNKVVD